MENHMEHGIITPLLLLLILLVSIAAAQPGGSPGSDLQNPYVGANLTASVAIVVVVFVAIIFFAAIFSIFLRRGSERGGGGGGSIRRMVNAIAGMSRRGLDSEALAALPTFAYSEVKGLKIGMGALECAVCLCEFDDDETLRLLPKCDHVFHADCIDAWLASHTTCPVCRSVVAADLEPAEEPSAAAAAAAAAAAGEADVQNDVVVVPVEGSADQLPTSQAPLPSRSRSVKAILFSKFPRSHSTGHSLLAVRPGGDCDRFTLKLPVDVRKQLVNRSLNRTAGEEFMRVRSSRRGYRSGDGSTRGKSIRRVDRAKSDRWAFLGRTSSLKTIKDGPGGGETSSAAVPPKAFVSNVITPLNCLGAKVNYDSSDETAPLPV